MIHLPMLVAHLLVTGTTAPPPPPIEVRVAVVAYEDFHGELRHFGEYFARLSQRDPSVQFKLAAGSYGEVLHWLDRQLIDLAVLTPGVFAGLLEPDARTSEPKSCRYLGTLQIPAARSRWADDDRRVGGRHGSYRSVCLVSQESGIKSLDDLRRLASVQPVELLFVHPLSISGRVVPQEALRQAKIPLDRATVRFTYSHSQSIRLLSDPAADRARVAFVWDDATGNDPALEEGVRQLPFPQLQQLKIPHDVIVARQGFSYTDRLQPLLLADLGGDQPYHFAYDNEWQTRYRRVRDWFGATDRETAAEDGENTTLDEIGQLLLQYSRAQPHPPRLALVLSGGGAKCSYQVGAVKAIEDKLAQLRRENPEHPLDINLVVGTSGGAINALPVAMGITASASGQNAFRDTWCELNQCEIVQPSLLVRLNMGLWFALLQTALVVWVIKWRVKDENRRGWAFAAAYTLLAGIEVLIGYLPFTPWKLLGSNHILHHCWLWLSFGVRASAWSLFLIGLGALALQAARARRGDHIRLPRRFTKLTLAIGLLGLPLLQVFTIFTHEETLSRGEGMESTLASKFPRLINRHLAEENLLSLELPDPSDASQVLQSASRQIVERGLLRRDLVITGSCLRQTSQELPPDLYFYVPSDPDNSVAPYGERGVSLRTRPQILLDVILGSGSIFPLFPARRIEGLPRSGEQIELVDGGFAHNSPVEAAVLWGATHIVLIDVSAGTRAKGGNFFRNLTSSVRHLHRQAQLLDARSREKVIIFTLSPVPPHMCVLDFANNLITASVERGYQDATQDAASKTPGFRRELGEPAFLDAAFAAGDTPP